MRRLLSLALTALMIISMFSIGVFTTTASAADLGVGEVEAGYTPKGTPISTAAEFAAITSGDYYLAADIEIDMINLNVFSGTLDGNGKTITVAQPLFSNVKDATFKNIIIAGEIDFASEENDWHLGALAQEGTNVTAENIRNTAEIIGYPTAKRIVTKNEITGEEVISYDSIYSGALFGSLYGNVTLKNCVNEGEVQALCAAGLVGSIKKVPKAEEDEEGLYKSMETTVLFENCHNFATVSDEDCYDLIITESDGTRVNKKQGLAAGLLAYGVATTTTFQSCTNTADILSENTGEDDDPSGKPSGTGGGVAGGIMAKAVESSSSYHHTVYFYDCINEGEVIGWSQIGGLGGFIQCDTQVFRCTNTGRVQSRNNYAAGIIGRPGVEGYASGFMLRFYYCVNTGEIVGHRQYAGGITSYSYDSIQVRYCLNTGNLYAEGLVEGNPESRNPHGHTVATGGIIVNISPVADVRYCVNTGNLISNQQAGGICCRAGSSGKAGYNTFVGCLNAGNGYVYAKNGGIVNFDQLWTEKADGTKSMNFYYTPYAAAGILAYSYGSGATQAPRIIGCGVTGTMNIDYGVACGFLGYTNTDSAIIMGNYLTGELNGPGECLTPHQVTWRTDYQLEYCTAWIDRVSAQRYITDNYFPEGHATKYKLLQDNGAEYGFDGYDCFFTQEELENGTLCYKLTKVCFEMFSEEDLLFCQKLDGTDGKFPTSPYYYTQEDGSVLYHVVKEGDKYVNTTFKYETTTDAPDTDAPTTEEVTTEEVTTEEVTTEEVTTEQPKVEDTTKKPDETTAEPKGGCGGVIGTSIALLALALIAPAGVMLKKKDEE